VSPRTEATGRHGTAHAQELTEAILAQGLTPRGGFQPRADDAVPPISPCQPAATLVLVGNAGARMWQRFCTQRDPARDRLDDWSSQIISGLAALFRARALFPMRHFLRAHGPG